MEGHQSKCNHCNHMNYILAARKEYFVSYLFLVCIFVEVYSLIALTGNYDHLRLHCSLGKVLVSSRAISILLVYWLGKSEAGHSCLHSSLLDSVFI